MRAAVLGLLFLALGSGCRADRDNCAKAAQHFAELVYWDRENARIEKLPAGERDAERKRALVAFNKEVDTQLDKWVHQCVVAGNDNQSECIIEAKTKEEALECAEVAKGPEGQRGCCDTGGGAPAGSLALAGLVALALGRRRRARR